MKDTNAMTAKPTLVVTITAGLIVLLVGAIFTNLYVKLPDDWWNFSVGIIGAVIGFTVSSLVFDKTFIKPLENGDPTIKRSCLTLIIGTMAITGVAMICAWLAQAIFSK